MKKFRVFIIAALCLCFCSVHTTYGQNKISGYEFWYDNDYAGKVVFNAGVPTEEFQVTGGMNATSLSPGLHAFHIRFKDDSGKWSSVISRFFEKVSGGSSFTNKIMSYEYWFDNDYSNKVDFTLGVPSEEFQVSGGFDASALTTGYHVFHMRFQDAGGTWSSVVSQFFQKVSDGSVAINQITHYEYWFDNDYASKVTSTVTPAQTLFVNETMNAADLEPGIHIAHIRFKDSGGTWSSVCSRFFNKTGIDEASANLITGYRYWFDSVDTDMTHVQLQLPTNVYQLSDPIDLIGITKGWHVMHLQFQDTLSNWSTTVSDSVYRYPVVNAACTPDNWLLCDSGIVNFSNNSFDADTFHWNFGIGFSSTLENPSHFFNTPGTHPVTLIAYDTLEGLSDTLILDISVATSPFVNLGCDTAICPSTLTLDAWNAECTYLWSNAFTDSIIHISTAANYSVTVTNQWGCTDRDTISVTMNPVPMPDLGNDTIICDYNSIILDAGSGFSSYDWSTGATSQTITVNTSGTFIAEVTNSYGCVNSDTIIITTDPCTGLSDIAGNPSAQIFPNPNDGTYSIINHAKSDGYYQVYVSDLSGRKIFTYENLFLKKDDIFVIDNSDLSSGIYMITITSDHINVVEKIIINH